MSDLRLGALVDRKRFSSTNALRSACHGSALVRFTLFHHLGSHVNPFIGLDKEETTGNLRVRFSSDRKPYTCTYDYDSDSDLEDDDDDEEIQDDELVDSPQTVMEEPRNDSELAIIENPDTRNSESPDVVSISDFGSVFSEPFDRKSETNHDSSTHVGKVVYIEDVAFVT